MKAAGRKIVSNRSPSKNAEQRSRLLALQEQKEVGRFLLPDAPHRKQKRKMSPKQVPCPLIPGTPEVLPERKPRLWEKQSTFGLSPIPDSSTVNEPVRETVLSKKVKLEPGLFMFEVNSDDEPGGASSEPDSSRFEFVSVRDPVTKTFASKHVPKVENTSPKRKCSISFPAMTGTEVEVKMKDGESVASRVTMEELLNIPSPLPNVEIECLGFTPKSSERWSPVHSSPETDSSFGSSRQEPDIFEGSLELEINVESNLGSDIEEDPEMSTIWNRNVFDCPADVCNDLPSDVLIQLEKNDQSDDCVLRSMASAEMQNFQWSQDPDIFIGQRETFTGQAGPTFSTEGLSPLDIFEKIWDNEIIEQIVCETNRYAHDLLNNLNLKKGSRLIKWKDVTPDEIWTFFGILMLQSIVPLPVESEYWMPSLPYLQVGRFPDIMPYKRFLLIKKCLHFVNNYDISSVPAGDKKLAKIKPIICYLNEKFKQLYMPEQNIALDESLLLWKGRLSFAQLMNNKAAKTGIKSYELCESRTGYLWNILIYTGKTETVPNKSEVKDSSETVSATSKVVLDLVSPLLNKGHTLVMDNYYNSPLLSRYLKTLKTDTIGTLRLNREFLPESLKQKNKYNMRTGEVAFSQTEDLTVVVWKDANVVSLISTFHKVEVGGKEKYGYYKYKPKVVLDYNLSMGGVDKKDQMLAAFPVERVRNSVWYKKLFRRLLNVSIHNSFVIYSHQKKYAQRQFRLELADAILKKRNLPKPLPAQAPATGHFPIRNRTCRARCKVCAQRKVETRTVWKCDTCHVNLCIIQCFRQYHT